MKFMEWIKLRTATAIAGDTLSLIEGADPDEIHDAAIEKHDHAYLKTTEVLEKLGQTKKVVIDSFVRFADLMEEIKGLPKFKINLFSAVKLPAHDPIDLKNHAEEVEKAILEIGEENNAALVGLAAFGSTSLLVSPMAIKEGVILCVKGVRLRKKEIENKKEAKKLSKSMEEVISYYEKLQNTAISFEGSIKMIYEKYRLGLERIEATLEDKDLYLTFSSRDKKTVENTVLMARLLYEMVRTTMIVQEYKDDQVETINSQEIEKLQKQAAKLVMA